MAFDAGLMAAVTNELESRLAGARIEKIYQPSRDMIIFTLKCRQNDGGQRESVRLLLDAGASNPRICLTSANPENPVTAPMFCMLLRKHLGSARLSGVRQLGFERAAEFEFDTHDEMGFETKKYIIIEIMAKCSNLIFCDADHRITAVLKPVDFSLSQKRQLLPGMKYELPPVQEGKISPFEENEQGFKSKRAASELPDDRFIMSNYCGISPLVARELAYRSERSERSGDSDLWGEFSKLCAVIKEKRFTPVLVTDKSGKPIEYSFIPIGQYENEADTSVLSSFSELIDSYFSKKSAAERIHQRSSDILKLLTNAETRIKKKIAIQTADLESCKKKDRFKQIGELITANLYRLKQGDRTAELVNYYSEDMETVKIELDARLTPAQNAQQYFKKYNKSKSAEAALSCQLELAKAELNYIDTVFDSLSKAETEADLAEIRKELYTSGYASKMKSYSEQKKMPKSKPMEFVTSGGYRLLCGKNNSQNDELTFKLASKGDLWFHVKGIPGSHVVLFCNGEEPDAKDFTEAATVAAVYSKAKRGQKVEVDYTRIKNIKKPPASKPGFVTYQTNYSAYVDADEKLAALLRRC